MGTRGILINFDLLLHTFTYIFHVFIADSLNTLFYIRIYKQILKISQFMFLVFSFLSHLSLAAF